MKNGGGKGMQDFKTQPIMNRGPDTPAHQSRSPPGTGWKNNGMLMTHGSLHPPVSLHLYLEYKLFGAGVVFLSSAEHNGPWLGPLGTTTIQRINNNMLLFQLLCDEWELRGHTSSTVLEEILHTESWVFQPGPNWMALQMRGRGT